MENTTIEYIDSTEKLSKIIDRLQQKTEFAFDTEFDRFYREYGFKLSLLQIFDGESVYLVDPISIKNLSPLWPVFEDPKICKVAYSCSEDIQILKVNKCQPKNIYDIQVAAKLCNYPATSLSALMLAEFGIESDKTLQRSNWRRRPLSKEQLYYAGNDVTRLLTLKHTLETMAEKRGVSRMIAEENKACERIPVTEFSVKLSVNQKRKYEPALQKNLLDLMLLRNEIAMAYNTPPANIVGDTTLESIIENKYEFLADPFRKGFSKKMTEDLPNRQRFLDLIQQISSDYVARIVPVKKPRPQEEMLSAEIADTEFDRKYDLLYNDIISSFGKESGEYILRGFKKFISSYPPRAKKLKEYQQTIIDNACKKLGIDFK